jgi:hypothetical protein
MLGVASDSRLVASAMVKRLRPIETLDVPSRNPCEVSMLQFIRDVLHTD